MQITENKSWGIFLSLTTDNVVSYSRESANLFHFERSAHFLSHYTGLIAFPEIP